VERSDIAAGGGREMLAVVLRRLLQNPYAAFVRSWNWKAAALSVILRAPVYVATTIHHGWRRATLEAFVEGGFSACASGVYGAFTQAVRDAEPQSAVACLLVVVLPAITLTLDSLLHWAIGTPNLHAGITASFVVSVLSSLFTWYSMRRGTLLVGSEGESFWSDLARLPLLILRFLAEPFGFLRRKARRMCWARS